MIRGREMEEIFWKWNQQDFAISGYEVLERFKNDSGRGNLESFTELRTQKERRSGEISVLEMLSLRCLWRYSKEYA